MPAIAEMSEMPSSINTRAMTRSDHGTAMDFFIMFSWADRAAVDEPFERRDRVWDLRPFSGAVCTMASRTH